MNKTVEKGQCLQEASTQCSGVRTLGSLVRDASHEHFPAEKKRHVNIYSRRPGVSRADAPLRRRHSARAALYVYITRRSRARACKYDVSPFEGSSSLGLAPGPPRTCCALRRPSAEGEPGGNDTSERRSAERVAYSHRGSGDITLTAVGTSSSSPTCGLFASSEHVSTMEAVMLDRAVLVDRVRGALWGTLIADAVSMPVHWCVIRSANKSATGPPSSRAARVRYTGTIILGTSGATLEGSSTTSLPRKCVIDDV